MSESDDLTVDYATQIYKGELHPTLQRQGTGDGAKRKPWHQMEGETARSYVGFQIYLDMGSARTLKDVGRIIYGERKDYSEIQKWSRENSWVKRADAWDHFVATTHITQMETAVVETEQIAMRYLPKVAHRLAEAAAGNQTLSRNEMAAVDSFMDRYGTPKQKAKNSLTVNNFNVTAPALPEQSTRNLLKDADEAEYKDISSQADNLIPEGLRK